MSRPRLPTEHGTWRGYERDGCRCDLCRAYKQRRNEDYIAAMREQGLSHRGAPLKVGGVDCSDAIDEVARFLHGGVLQ